MHICETKHILSQVRLARWESREQEVQNRSTLNPYKAQIPSARQKLQVNDCSST